MLKWLPFLALGLTPPGCQNKPLPPPADVVSAPALGLAIKDKDSKLSAHAEATEVAIKAGPEGAPKDAASGAISVVRSLAGPSNPEDRAAALALVNQALKGRLEEAETGWTAAKINANTLLARIDELERQVEDERSQAAIEWQKKLDKATLDADKERKRWIMAIFFGFGALGVAGGVIMFILLANPTTAASYAFLGPKAGFCAIGAGLTLIATGIAVNAIERLIEAHPWVFGGMVFSSLTLIGISAVLTYGNHKHANEPK